MDHEETTCGRSLWWRGKDALEARGALGSSIHQLVDEGSVEVITPYKIQHVVRTKDGMDIVGYQEEQEVKISDVHEMIVNTGNRPNLSILSELRTSIDSATESVATLAPLIDLICIAVVQFDLMVKKNFANRKKTSTL